MGYAALAGFGVLLLRARGIGGGASMFTAFAIAVFASRIVLGRMPDRAGAQTTATAAGLLEALGLAVIALAKALAVALAGAVVVGVGFSMLFPSLALMVVGGVGEHRRASRVDVACLHERHRFVRDVLAGHCTEHGPSLDERSHEP